MEGAISIRINLDDEQTPLITLVVINNDKGDRFQSVIAQSTLFNALLAAPVLACVQAAQRSTEEASILAVKQQ